MFKVCIFKINKRKPSRLLFIVAKKRKSKIVVGAKIFKEKKETKEKEQSQKKTVKSSSGIFPSKMSPRRIVNETHNLYSSFPLS